MNKDDKNRHFGLLIIDISKHGATSNHHHCWIVVKCRCRCRWKKWVMSKWQDPVSWMMFQKNLRTNRNQSNRNPQPSLFILWYNISTIRWLNKHSRENHPYHCYYCKTTFVLFEEVIKHSTENHGSLILKVKYLELNPSSGQYGYKSHNFNVIPEKIKALYTVPIQKVYWILFQSHTFYRVKVKISIHIQKNM